MIDGRHFLDGLIRIRCVASLSPILWRGDKESIVHRRPALMNEREALLLGEFTIFISIVLDPGTQVYRRAFIFLHPFSSFKIYYVSLIYFIIFGKVMYLSILLFCRLFLSLLVRGTAASVQCQLRLILLMVFLIYWHRIT
jgi:hypothetical protein